MSTVLNGHVDVPAAGATVDTDVIRARGWALGPDGPVAQLQVAVEGGAVVPARPGRPRGDVAAAYPAVPNAASGAWEAGVDLRQVDGDTATIRLLGRDPGGELVEIDRVQVTRHPSRGGRRPFAVFTIVQDESVFLPIWLRHYGQHADADDLYVLDHDSTDGSVRRSGARNVVPVHRTTTGDFSWHRDVVEEFQHFLLRSYETVLYVDADELVAPDPRRFPTLSDYVAAMNEPVIACTGYNLTHLEDEAPLDVGAPVLAQRRWWHPSPLYSKPVLARIPLRWAVGFHHESSDEFSAPVDPSLVLVHLHRADRDLCLSRHLARVARPWDARSIASGMGWQIRVVDDEEFDAWFRAGADLEGRPVQRIPEHLRTIG